MTYKTVEADRDGRVIIYPSLYEPKGKGICKLLRGLLNRILPGQRK
jgi:hypothetical protein